MRPNFTRKTIEEVYEAQNGFCKIGVARIDDFHHRVPNTRLNQSKYPLFLQSPFNCVGLSRKAHDSQEIYTELTKITDKEAQMYEDFLQKLNKGQK